MAFAQVFGTFNIPDAWTKIGTNATPLTVLNPTTATRDIGIYTITVKGTGFSQDGFGRYIGSVTGFTIQQDGVPANRYETTLITETLLDRVNQAFIGDELKWDNFVQTLQYLVIDGSVTPAVFSGFQGSPNNDVFQDIAGRFNDFLNGGDGMDTLDGGGGNDTITGGNQADMLFGGGGNDVITGGPDSASDTIDGGDGNDNIGGGDGNDSLFGGNDADTISGGEGQDTIDGGESSDVLAGGTGNDSVDGSFGQDTLIGGEGQDTLNGGFDGDNINGNGGTDTISGGFGDDIIKGGLDADSIDGGSGGDNIHGNDGDDTLFGSFGDDDIFGDTGNDILDGEDGADLLIAGVGNDTLNGDAGNDILNGGAGNDFMTGGMDDDRFVFTGLFGNDQVTDFQEGFDMVVIGGAVALDVNLVQAGTDVLLIVNSGSGTVGNITIQNGFTDHFSVEADIFFV